MDSLRRGVRPGDLPANKKATHPESIKKHGGQGDEANAGGPRMPGIVGKQPSVQTVAHPTRLPTKTNSHGSRYIGELKSVCRKAL
jgi:hypothetical protein